MRANQKHRELRLKSREIETPHPIRFDWGFRSKGQFRLSLLERFQARVHRLVLAHDFAALVAGEAIDVVVAPLC
jgi:hypothetical protein